MAFGRAHTCAKTVIVEELCGKYTQSIDVCHKIRVAE